LGWSTLGSCGGSVTRDKTENPESEGGGGGRTEEKKLEVRKRPMSGGELDCFDGGKDGKEGARGNRGITGGT